MSFTTHLRHRLLLVVGQNTYNTCGVSETQGLCSSALRGGPAYHSCNYCASMTPFAMRSTMHLGTKVKCTVLNEVTLKPLCPNGRMCAMQLLPIWWVVAHVHGLLLEATLRRITTREKCQVRCHYSLCLQFTWRTRCSRTTKVKHCCVPCVLPRDVQSCTSWLCRVHPPGCVCASHSRSRHSQHRCWVSSLTFCQCTQSKATLPAHNHCHCHTHIMRPWHSRA